MFKLFILFFAHFIIPLAFAVPPKFDFDKKFQRYGDFKNGPGLALSVLKADKVIFQSGYGSADQSHLITAQTNFDLASLSKQFTATGIILLEERGLIHRQDKIIKYFPEFPVKYANIKVWHLIHHLSGLPDYMHLCQGEEDNKIFNKDVISFLKNGPELNFKPGENFEYSNTGYVLLASLIERVSGQSFPEFMSSQIFAPLQMEQTKVFSIENAPLIKNRATSREEYPFLVSYQQQPCNYLFGDGGVYSSIDDLKKWAVALTNDSFLSQSSLKKIFQVVYTHKRKLVPYGYGFFLDDYSFKSKRHFHGGSWLGFRHYMTYFPENDFWVIMLSNYAGITLEDHLEEIIKEIDPGLVL